MVEPEEIARRDTARLERLRGKHAGRQCVVLCTGPSVLDLDLTVLDGHPFLMGVNGAYVLRSRFHSYFTSNAEFVVNNIPAIARVDAQHIFMRRTDRQRFVDGGVDETRLLSFEGAQGEVSAQISTDLTRPLPWGPTVLLTIALPAALWFGFEEILLVGADYPRHGYRRFHTGSPAGPRQVRKSMVAYETEMEVARFRASLWARHLAEHHPNVRVLNCSPGSELDAFERADLARVVRTEAAS